MNRSLLFTVALTCCAAAATAQTTQLQFYLWSAGTAAGYGNGSSEESDSTFSPMYAPRIQAYAYQRPFASAADSGIAAAGSAQAVIQNYAYRNLIFPGHIALFPLGFGVWDWDPPPGQGVYGWHAACLYDQADAINPDASGNPQVDWSAPATAPTPDVYYRNYKQPWMTQGRKRTKDWMAAFLDSYSARGYVPYGGGTALLPLPVPDRFMLDIELEEDMCSPYTINDTRILEAVAQDPRWSDPAYPVPGFGTQTMNDLWLAARAKYDPTGGGVTWTSLSLYDYLQTGPTDNRVRDRWARDPALRGYFLWYNEICQKAVDAAIKEVVYDQVHALWPNCRISNFAHTKVDGKQDTFGWFPRADDSRNGSLYEFAPHFFVPETHAVRAPMTRGWDGLFHRINDLVEPGSDPTYPSNIWLYEKQDTSADISAPELFLWSQQGWSDADRHSYYIPAPYPPNPANPDYQDSPRNTSLRCQRQWLESILNSDDYGTFSTPHHGPTQISPEAIYPDPQVLWWSDVPDSQISPEYFLSQLAMFRAKDLGELQIFTGHFDSSHMPAGNALFLYQHVYTPQLTDYAVVQGCETSTPGELQRLWFTLRDPGHETVDVTAASNCYGGGASLEVTFDNLLAAADGDLALNLECSASVPGLVGRVYVWQPSLGQWASIAINDSPDDQFIFGFYAPTDSQGRSGTRRTFHIPNSVVTGLDKASVWIAIFPPTLAVPADFDVKFDLVQAYWELGIHSLDGSCAVTPPSGQIKGADMDHNGIIDGRDLELFYSYYGLGMKAADFNHDGVVDSQDLIAFLTQYALH